MNPICFCDVFSDDGFMQGFHFFFSESDSEEKNVSNQSIFLNTGDEGNDKIDRT